ncbi:leucine-rich repeat protein [Mycoplasma sp. Sp33II]|uniref:leucine-rich repeat protein n=1 Tax=unclassified Mycoplasma TaxID=2683645 RepID=UPI003AAC69F4
MTKVAKYLLVITSGVAVGSAIIAIPSVIYGNQKKYQNQLANLKQTEKDLMVIPNSSIEKSKTLASKMTKNDISFVNYNKDLFNVELVDITTELTNKLSAMPGKEIVTVNKDIQYFHADDNRGILEFVYKIQSKKYDDLFIVKKAVIDGFKIVTPIKPITEVRKPIAEIASMLTEPIITPYKTISSDQTKGLKANQAEAISQYGQKVAQTHVKVLTNILKTVEDVLPVTSLQLIKDSYQSMVLKFNNALTDVLTEAIKIKSVELGKDQIDNYFTAQKLTEIKNIISETLKSRAQDLTNIAKTILETLKNNETTKNIDKIDEFITEISNEFHKQILDLTNKIKQMPIASKASASQILNQTKDLIAQIKKALEAKAIELLKNETDLMSVKKNLKNKFDSLDDLIKSNLEMLDMHMKDMATLIDALDLAPKTVPNNDVVSFEYNDGKNTANVQYNPTDERIVIKDIENLDENTFSSILNLTAEKIGSTRRGIVLDCPDAKTISLSAETMYSIKKVNLPKLEKVVYSEDYTLSSPALWTRSLEGDKVIINGIVFKWNNAKGDINDETITQILPYAFEDTDKISSINFPNVKEISRKAFGNQSQKKLFPQIKSKIILNGVLIKWPNAEGDISDSTVTSISNGVFENNEKITSVSFPNVTEIGDNAFNRATNLKSIKFPKATKIGEWAFAYNSNLEKIELPKAEVFGSNSLLRTNKLSSKIVLNGVLVKWEDASGELYDDKIEKIASAVFLSNKKITKVDFPNVKEIGSFAFNNTPNLLSVNLPKLEKIGEFAFMSAESLKKAIFPNVKIVSEGAFWDTNQLEEASFINATEIGDKAFYNANKLKIINFPIVKTIGFSAFENANSLKSASFPEAREIKSYAFYHNINLTSILFPKTEEIQYSAFADTPKLNGKIVIGTTLVKWDNAEGNLEDSNITKISNEVFKDNTKITSVSFPNVTEIGNDAFNGATNLASANMPKVTKIGRRAFCEAKSLTSVDFPELTSISWSSFSNATKLTSVNFPKAAIIGTSAFSNATNLTNIHFPEAVQIESEAFSGAKSLTIANFPKVKVIEDSAFQDAVSLSNISFPILKELHGPNIFKNTPKLNDKIIINGVLVKWDNASGDLADSTITSVQDGVFNKNNNITSISFPNVVSVGDNAFNMATNLSSISLPKVKIIKSSAFLGITKLTSISFPELETIENRAFQNVSNLASAELPNVIEIGRDAFEKCSSLKTINLPKATNIDSGAFRNATQLTTISLPNVIKISNEMFYGAENLSLVSAPNAAEIGEYAFANANGLVTLTFPKVEIIGERAFYNVKNLESAYFPEVLFIKGGAFLSAINLSSFYAPKVKIIAPDAFDHTPKLTNKPNPQA